MPCPPCSKREIIISMGPSAINLDIKFIHGTAKSSLAYCIKRSEAENVRFLAGQTTPIERETIIVSS